MKTELYKTNAKSQGLVPAHFKLIIIIAVHVVKHQSVINKYMPAKPTYGVYVSQLIRISRICDNYVSFVKRHRLLTERLIKQGFWYSKLGISFKKFSRRHSMLFNKYAVSVKRHIREGICIPLDVKPDLVRNITTRNRGCGQFA